MKTMIAAALALGLACALVQPAVASATCPPMDLSLNKSLVEMGMTYAGETVAVSGSAPEGSQVAVVLISKDNPPLKLSRKGRVGLFWMGVKQLEACNMPYLYKVYASGPLARIASAEQIKELGLGYDNLRGELVTKCVSGEPSADDAEVLFGGFIKLKEDAGLYGVQEGQVIVGPDGRFEQALTLPDRAAEGDYFIHAYAFKDGQLVATATRELVARKVGLGKWLAITARDNGLFYGLIAVVVALGAGLGTGMVFKKGGGH